MKHRALFHFVVILFSILLDSRSSVAQWVRTNGPGGGTIYSLAANGSTVFAGTWGGGVFRSTDNGANWTVTNDGLTDLTAEALLATGSMVMVGTQDGGIFVSRNNGDSWTTANNGLASTSIFSLAQFGTVILAGTGSGIYRSVDNGANWVAANKGPASNAVYAFAASANNFFAATPQGALLSVDDGLSWKSVSNGLTNPSLVSIAAFGTKLFAGTNAGEVYASTNSGANWSLVSASVGKVGVGAFIASGTRLLAGTGPGILTSTDDGMSWSKLGGYTEGANAFVVSGTSILAGTYYAGVWRSTDGGVSWMPSRRGLANSDVGSISIVGSNVVAGTNGSGVGMLSNGTDWTEISNGLGDGHVTAVTSIGTTLFAATRFTGGVSRSTDNGSSWTSVSNGFEDTSVMALAVNRDTLFAACMQGGSSNWGAIYRSTDLGSHWKKTALGGAPFDALLVADTFVFASAYYGGLYRENTDGTSGTWLDRAPANIMAYTSLGSTVFVGTDGSGGVSRSSDNGLHWSATNAGLTNQRVHALATSGSTLFAGTEGGVFYSSDNGAHWIQANNGLTDTIIHSLVVDGKNLYAGTYRSGVWRRPLSEFPGQNFVQAGSRTAQEVHCFPNPLSTSTTIEVTSNGGYAVVSIVNPLGVEVARLFQGELSAGNHSFEWNAKNVAPGSYICQVHRGGVVDRTSMMLVR